MQIRQQIALWGRDIPKNSCEVFLATYRVRYILLFVSIGKLTKEDRMEASVDGVVPMERQAPAFSHAGAQLPLALVSAGETVRVLKVHGGTDLRQHLAELGFVENAEVKVVSRVNGDVIVSVKGATFGLNRDMARKITTY